MLYLKSPPETSSGKIKADIKSALIFMVEYRGIDESRRFADRKPSASLPRADAPLRSDQNSPLDCFALSGFDPPETVTGNKKNRRWRFILFLVEYRGIEPLTS